MRMAEISAARASVTLKAWARTASAVPTMTGVTAAVRVRGRLAMIQGRSRLAAEGLVEFIRLDWWGGRGSNPHVVFTTADFKSAASAIPPPPQVNSPAFLPSTVSTTPTFVTILAVQAVD